LAVLKDFLFAGAVTDISSKLGSIFSQLSVVRTQFPAVLLDLFSCAADRSKSPSLFYFMMVTMAVMMNVTPEMMPVALILVLFLMIAVAPVIGSFIPMNFGCGWYPWKYQGYCKQPCQNNKSLACHFKPPF
jgi:hypothetical protein